jgi:transposase
VHSRSLSPCPAEVQVERLIAKADPITLVVRAVRRAVACPSCAQPSSRIHSYYDRRLADLPWNGVAVEIRLRTRRFFCDTEDCARHIFTERLPETTATYARRTLRMEQALRWLALALGGEAGARTAQRLGFGVSGDTLLYDPVARLGLGPRGEHSRCRRGLLERHIDDPLVVA